MEGNFFSLFTGSKPAGFNNTLLEAVLNSVPVGIQFLSVIRDSKNEIIEFEYVMVNSKDQNGKTGKTFRQLYPGDKILFEKLKELIETGTPFQTGHISETGDGRPALHYMKFGDGILISNEPRDHEWQHRINEPQQMKPPVDRNSGTDAGGEMAKLNSTLLEKNKELEILASELTTINSVASTEYRETIQRLYTNLEYIVSSDGRAMSDTSKANIRRAQAAIQRMKLMSDDINSFLHLCSIGINKSLVNPNAILGNVISGMKGKIEQANAHIESAHLPELLADPLLLSFLFTRLLENSIKFRKLVVPPLIKIKYSEADEMNVISTAKKDTKYTIISISDNGIGLNADDADKIFDLFYTVHEKIRYKGSGIGLSACKKIMAMHGGFIIADGLPAQGTTISCYFPGPE